MHSLIRKLFVCFVIPSILGFSVAEALSQDHQQTRLAIVDVGASNKAQEPFLDVLTAAFSKQPAVALLERTEIAKLLREQSLSLSMSNADMVKTGKLLAADSLLMLEANTTEGKTLLRCRLVDASYGFKLWDASLPFSAKPEEYRIQAEILARQATQKIGRIKLDPQKLILLGVSNFSSEELSPKWEWLSNALATSVEQNLALYPGVVLMERMKTGALRDERTLVAGLPEALKASAVLVDGSFKMQRDKGPDSILVYVRCRKQDRNLGEARIEGSIRELGDLYPKIVATIASSLGRKPDKLLMQPAAEAAMLANDARSFLKIHDPEQAAPLAEAALSLTPDSADLKMLMIEASLELPFQYFRRTNNNKDIDKFKEGLNLFITTTLKIYPLIEEEMLADSVQLSQLRYLPNGVEPYFHSMNNWFSEASRNHLNINLKQKEALKEIVPLYWHLYKLGMGSYPEGSTRRQRIMYLAGWVFEFSSTVEEAIQLSKDMLLNNNTVINSLGSLLSCLRNPQYAEWPKQKGATEKIARYLEELTQSDSSRMRLLGEWASMEFYRNNIDKQRQHCERLLELYKKEDLLVRDNIIFLMIPAAFSNMKVSADAREDKALKAKYCLDMLEYAFQKQLFNKNSQLDSNLAQAVVGAINHYIDTNRIPEASALFQRATAEFKGDNALITLAIAKNKLMNLSMNRKPYRNVLLYSSKGRYPEIHFLRLLVNDNTQAVVYSDTAHLTQLTQFGIMQLSPENLAPLSSQLLPYKMKYIPGLDSNRYYSEGPEAAADDQAIYLGVKRSGIAVFYKDGSSKLWNEETGLATNVVRSLEILDGKLYASVGGFGSSQKDNGLMEVDLKTGISTVLFSNKAKENKEELDGALITGIAADPERHTLWILCSEEHSPLRLYRYYPQSKKLDRVDSESLRKILFFMGPQDTCLRKLKDSIIFQGDIGSMMIDAKTEAATLLLGFYQPTSWMAKWSQSPPAMGLQPRQLIPINRDLIAITHQELLYFHDGEKDPENLEQSLTKMGSERPAIRDIALTKKGLLVLTDDSLYLIPEIVE